MQLDSPHYTRCLKILSRSPLFASLDDALLKDMLKMLQRFRSITRTMAESIFCFSLDLVMVLISSVCSIVSGMTLWLPLSTIWRFSPPHFNRQESGLICTLISIGHSFPIWGNKCTDWQIKLLTSLSMIPRYDWRDSFSGTWFPTSWHKKFP